MKERLRITDAAKMLGVHPQTLRSMVDDGQIPCVWINNFRTFATSDLQAFLGYDPGSDQRRVVGYARVSGGGDQKSSLAAQKKEIGAVEAMRHVYFDVGSGLSQKRRGLGRLLEAVESGDVKQVVVTHEDRLTRFGIVYLERLFAAYDCELVVLHPSGKSSPDEELMSDFMSLIASFSGRLYGMRSAENRRRLLDKAEQEHLAL